jgi:hypothetical protein
MVLPRNNPLDHVSDLTAHIVPAGQYAVAYGGYSDIYRGVWNRLVQDDGRLCAQAVPVKFGGTDIFRGC